jgi:type I restriction enzyme S subunit
VEKIRFDNFIKLNRGFDLPDSQIEEGMYPVVASTNIKAYHNTYKVDGPMVVTGRSGSLGSVQYIDGKCWPLNTALYVKDFKGNNPRYVYYYLKTMHLEQYNAGAGVPTLNQNHLHSLKINIHDKAEQARVSSILSVYDDLIEKNNRKIAILREMAEEIYKEWFVRRKSNQWPIVKMREFGYQAESGKRPKGGIDDSLIEGVPSLGAEVIDKLGMFDFSNVKLVPEEFYQSMKKGIGKDKDILLYKDGAYIGKVTLFMDNFPYEKYAVNEHVFLIRANNKLYQYYLYFTLNQQQYFTQMQNLNRNAAQPGLTPSDIDIVKLCKPDEEIIKKFNRVVEPMLHSIFTIAKQNNILKTQRDLLLPRLMSGKLEVKA